VACPSARGARIVTAEGVALIDNLVYILLPSASCLTLRLHPRAGFVPDTAPSPQGRLGPALRRAWLGYQRRLDAAMSDAGFDDRQFPDGRVLRLCSGPTGSTISGIGRELGITRQGAGKVVARLRDRGYVSVADSATSGREKSVTVTPRGAGYLEAQRKAARTIDAELRGALGDAGIFALSRLLDALDQDGRGDQGSLRAYLQRSGDFYESAEEPSGPSTTVDTEASR
jgi:DNA-binding MarR family transcriptional regulator